ncbi:MAG: cell division protein FtsZ, partial [Gammaproteobacteria bacterium]|nr:cell division protein FtsZ [Gammaproteobacteria bacterium]
MKRRNFLKLLSSSSFASSLLSLDLLASVESSTKNGQQNNFGINTDEFELPGISSKIEMESFSDYAQIKVIGVGGGGGNAVQQMIEYGIEGVQYICIDTDIEALNKMSAKPSIQIGHYCTSNSGSEKSSEAGEKVTMDDRESIQEAISGSDMIFIIAGMGGETGTSAAPIIAQIAKEMEILTIAVVTKPYAYEGGKLMALAEKGIKELSEHVDSFITIPNDKLMLMPEKQDTTRNVFNKANDILRIAVQDIAELIICPGLICIDFADVRTVTSEMGMAMMSLGEAIGENRAKSATLAAISSPLLNDIHIADAHGILVTVTAG